MFQHFVCHCQTFRYMWTYTSRLEQKVCLSNMACFCLVCSYSYVDSCGNEALLHTAYNIINRDIILSDFSH